MKLSTIRYGWLSIFVPGLIGFTVTAIEPMDKDSGKNVWFRPPGYVFSLIWPILYLLLGYAVYKSKSAYTQSLLSLLVLTLVIWPVVYKRNKKYAHYLIWISNLFAMLAIAVTDQKIVRISLTPLVLWLFFAASLSSFL